MIVELIFNSKKHWSFFENMPFEGYEFHENK